MSETPVKVGRASNGGLLHYSVGAIIQDPSRKKIFLADRKFEPFGYAGPAGHIDAGEDPLAAIRRELSEEIGAVPDDLTFRREEEVLGNHCWRAPSHYWYLYQGTLDPSRVVVDPHEAGRWGWFEPQKLKLMPLEPVWRHWLTLEHII